MKKLTVLLLALLLIAAVCTGCSSRDKAGDSAPAATVKPDPPLEELLAAVRSAENAGEAIRVVTQTGSADDRLALMNEIADVFAEELETGGWDFRMDQISFGSGLWPIPDTENAVQAENPAELFSGRRIVALYNRKGSLRFLTEFFVRLPKSMRAASVADADSVLYLKEYLEERTDYTGKAYNRIYELFLIDLKDQTAFHNTAHDRKRNPGRRRTFHGGAVEPGRVRRIQHLHPHVSRGNGGVPHEILHMQHVPA